MVTDKEAIEAFEVLHDYCDNRECKNCIFHDEKRTDEYCCILRGYTIAFLRVEEVPTVTYKIRRDSE